MTQKIKCPSCNFEFLPDEILSHQLEEKYRLEYEEKQKQKNQENIEKEKALEEKAKKLELVQQDLINTVNKQVAAKLPEIEKKAKEEAVEKAQKEYSEKIETIKTDNEDRDKQNKELREQISDLMKQLREMKTKDEDREIEYQKKIMEEESNIKSKAKQEAMEESQLQIAQKEKQLEDLRKQLSEAQRKAEQGSQQTQGEVLELEIEEILKQKFPSDDIIPVAKGVNGADITHKVIDKFGQVCGTIVWETKRTKNWVDGWVPKLKDDQRNQKAEIAVLVTMVLPKEIKNFSVKDGVWVSDFNSIIGLATALRSGLINVSAVKQASVGKNEKMEFLYNYLSGIEFKQKIEAIVESFTAMKSDLEREKRAMTKIWETRDRQISRVVDNTVKMYGDLTGLMGKALPKIDLLELTEGENQ